MAKRMIEVEVDVCTVPGCEGERRAGCITPFCEKHNGEFYVSPEWRAVRNAHADAERAYAERVGQQTAATEAQS